MGKETQEEMRHLERSYDRNGKWDKMLSSGNRIRIETCLFELKIKKKS